MMKQREEMSPKDRIEPAKLRSFCRGNAKELLIIFTAAVFLHSRFPSCPTPNPMPSPPAGEGF